MKAKVISIKKKLFGFYWVTKFLLEDGTIVTIRTLVNPFNSFSKSGFAEMYLGDMLSHRIRLMRCEKEKKKLSDTEKIARIVGLNIEVKEDC